MKKPFNSITDIFNNIVRLNNNNLKLLNGLINSFLTEQDYTSIVMKDINGVDKNYQIPSYSFLRKKMNVFELNISQLFNLYKKNNNLPGTDAETTSEPSVIGTINKVSEFHKELNSEARYLYKDRLHIHVDLTGKIHPHSKFVICKKVIIDDDPTKPNNVLKTVWDGFASKTDVTYKGAIDTLNLNSNDISYNEEESYEIVSPSELKVSGGFSVLKIYNDTIQDAEYTIARKYTFDTIYYNDLSIDKEKTLSLKINDKLVTNDGLSQFIVRSIDIVKSDVGNQYDVTLAQINGTSLILLNDSLKIISDVNLSQIIKVPVGLNEKMMLFFKPVDPYFHTTTRNYSPALLINSNDLNNVSTDGTQTDLKKFYITNVSDYTKVLDAVVKEEPTKTAEVIVPDAPLLDSNNFKVLQINTQRTSSNNNVEVEKLMGERASLDAQESALLQKLSVVEDNYRKGLTMDSVEYTNQVNTINSMLSDVRFKRTQLDLTLSNVMATNSINVIDPKYQVRGFWNIPEGKKDSLGNIQEVVQFKVRFRYLDSNGNPNSPSNLPYKDIDGKIKPATFSEWNEFVTRKREKYYDDVDKVWKWKSEELDSSSMVNINQLTLPINSNEGIEFTISSLSQDGLTWSSFSNVVKVEFPKDLQVLDSKNKTLLQIATEENLKAKYNDLLKSNQVLTDNYKQLDNLVKSTSQYQEITTVTKPNPTTSGLAFSLRYDPIPTMPISIYDGERTTLLNPIIDYGTSGRTITLTPDYLTNRFASATKVLYINYTRQIPVQETSPSGFVYTTNV